jgi:serine/threonine-protein kinase CHEK1
MRVHAVLKHANVLEFMNAVVVEIDKSKGYVPAYYILLEIAAGGDLFDKICEFRHTLSFPLQSLMLSYSP